MITNVATFSAAQLRKIIDRGWPDRHPFEHERLVCIGLDSDAADPSPLRDASGSFRHHHCVRVADWDPDGRHANEHAAGVRVDLAPTLRSAREIVERIVAWQTSVVPVALVAQCQGGLWRSGAIAEFVHADLGVPEADCSNRLVDVLVGGRWEGDRTFNVTLLRLLREAHKELVR